MKTVKAIILAILTGAAYFLYVKEAGVCISCSESSLSELEPEHDIEEGEYERKLGFIPPMETPMVSTKSIQEIRH